jgi:predicted kinase
LALVAKTIETKAELVKLDDEHRHVFGIFSVAEVGGVSVKDGEDDEIHRDELEKAAYNHVLDARIAGENHLRKGVGNLIESVVFTPEKTAAMVKAFADSGIAATIDIPAVAWWGGYHVHDDAVWKAIKDGDHLSFSIGGTADRVEDA